MRIRRGEYAAVFAAPPCSSFSVAHAPRLRSRDRPEGVQPMPRRWARYVEKHNRLAGFAADLVGAAHTAGVPWAVENPADYGDAGSPAWWPRMADHAPIWLLPQMRDALQRAGADTVTFAQCALGARARKYTTLAHARALSPHLQPLRDARCTHGTDSHPEVAYGRDQAGRAMAAQSAA
eukprot:3482620-Pleurochrysis_carterae.AAC.1